MRPMRRGILAAAAIVVTVVVTSAAATAAPNATVASASREHQATAAKRPLCSAIVSLGTVKAASGLGGMKMVPLNALSVFTKERGDFWAFDEAGSGSLAGSECLYNDPTPETSYTQAVFDEPDAVDGYVAVGYGESAKDWKAFEAAIKREGGGSPPEVSNDVPTSGLDGNAPVSPLDLGGGSKAFLETGNLIKAGDAEEEVTFPERGAKFPTAFYIVTVMTRHHDVLQVGIYNATLSATESLVKNVLKSDPKF